MKEEHKLARKEYVRVRREKEKRYTVFDGI